MGGVRVRRLRPPALPSRARRLAPPAGRAARAGRGHVRRSADRGQRRREPRVSAGAGPGAVAVAVAVAPAAPAAPPLTVLLPQMNADAAEPAPLWERPWSLDEIRKGSQSWSLASDAGVSGAAGPGPEPGAWGRVRGGAARGAAGGLGTGLPREGRCPPGPGGCLSPCFHPPVRAGKLTWGVGPNGDAEWMWLRLGPVCVRGSVSV